MCAHVCPLVASASLALRYVERYHVLVSPDPPLI